VQPSAGCQSRNESSVNLEVMRDASGSCRQTAMQRRSFKAPWHYLALVTRWVERLGFILILMILDLGRRRLYEHQQQLLQQCNKGRGTARPELPGGWD
jgi:hypothetical protein